MWKGVAYGIAYGLAGTMQIVENFDIYMHYRDTINSPYAGFVAISFTSACVWPVTMPMTCYLQRNWDKKGPIANFVHSKLNKLNKLNKLKS
jgi:hypothetical protein